MSYFHKIRVKKISYQCVDLKNKDISDSCIPASYYWILISIFGFNFWFDCQVWKLTFSLLYNSSENSLPALVLDVPTVNITGGIPVTSNGDSDLQTVNILLQASDYLFN